MPRRIYRYKLLLDENFPFRSKLPRLNGRFDLKHVAEDLRQSGIKDKEVFKIATKSQRIIVTFNDKDFFNITKGSKDTGVIGVSTNLSTEQIDKKLTSLLIKNKPKKLYGKFIYIRGEAKR